jgi:hypothetical protein
MRFLEVYTILCILAAETKSVLNYIHPNGLEEIKPLASTKMMVPGMLVDQKAKRINRSLLRSYQYGAVAGLETAYPYGINKIVIVCLSSSC